MEKMITTNEVLTSEDFEKIENILKKENIETMIIPSHDGISNKELISDGNIIIITEGENILLKKGSGYYTSHYLSDVNLLRVCEEVKISEHISVTNPQTNVQIGYMDVASEKIVADICYDGKKINDICLSTGADIKRNVVNKIINEHISSLDVNEMSDEELWELKHSLNVDSIAEAML